MKTRKIYFKGTPAQLRAFLWFCQAYKGYATLKLADARRMEVR